MHRTWITHWVFWNHYKATSSFVLQCQHNRAWPFALWFLNDIECKRFSNLGMRYGFAQTFTLGPVTMSCSIILVQPGSPENISLFICKNSFTCCICSLDRAVKTGIEFSPAGGLELTSASATTCSQSLQGLSRFTWFIWYGFLFLGWCTL